MLSRREPDFQFRDERGELVQLVHDGFRQINVITSKKGVVRGGHFHKRNREAFYIVSGKLELAVDGETSLFETGDFFQIEPYDSHSFYFLEDTVLVSMYSDGVEEKNGNKDIYPGEYHED